MPLYQVGKDELNQEVKDGSGGGARSMRRAEGRGRERERGKRRTRRRGKRDIVFGAREEMGLSARQGRAAWCRWWVVVERAPVSMRRYRERKLVVQREGSRYLYIYIIAYGRERAGWRRLMYC